jgi:hypothetical protein
MAFSRDFLLASSALTTIVGLIVLVIGVAKIRKGPSEGIILTVIGEVLIIVGFLASRYAE